MARVPGLTSMQDQPSQMRRAGSRVSAPNASDMRPITLSPTARPVDTYSRPEAPDQTNSLMQLAQTLSDINPSIQRFLVAKDDPKDSIAAVQKARLTMKPEEFDAAVKSGTLPGMKNAAYYELVGKDRAYDFLGQLDRDLGQFDPATQDFDQFYKERLAEYSKEMPEDRMFQSNFYDTVYQGIEQRRQNALTLKGRAMAEETQNAQMNVWSGMLQQMDVEHKEPGEKAMAIFADFDTNAKWRGMSYNDQQEMVLQLAEQRLNAGDSATARALLETERQNGAFKGSLLTSTKIAPRATDLLARIQKYENDQLEGMKIETASNQLRQDLQTMGTRGQLAYATDVELPAANGGTKKVTVDEQKKMWAQDYLTESQTIAQRGKENADQTRVRELAAFAQNGVKHPQWDEILKAGYPAGGFTSSSDEKTMPPALKDAWETYQWVHAQNPQYLSTLLPGKKELEFYEAIRIGMENHGDLNKAFLNAQYATSDPDGSIAANRAARDREISKAVDNMTWSDFANMGTVEDEVKRQADFYMRLGLNGSSAVNEAVKTIEKTHTWVNGSLIKTQGQNIPGNFASSVEELIADYAEKHPDEGISADDITIREQRPGVWIMVNKNNHLDPLWDGTDRVITLSRIAKWEDTKRTNKANDLAGTINSR